MPALLPTAPQTPVIPVPSQAVSNQQQGAAATDSTPAAPGNGPLSEAASTQLLQALTQFNSSFSPASAATPPLAAVPSPSMTNLPSKPIYGSVDPVESQGVAPAAPSAASAAPTTSGHASLPTTMDPATLAAALQGARVQGSAVASAAAAPAGAPPVAPSASPLANASASSPAAPTLTAPAAPAPDAATTALLEKAKQQNAQVRADFIASLTPDDLSSMTPEELQNLSSMSTGELQSYIQQKRLEEHSRMVTLMTNLLKMHNDSLMAIINNVRS